jgi:TonB-dependent starch-binding outer membrane protein SusC
MNLKRLFVAMMLSAFLFGMQAIAQDKMVTGKVTDANGAAVTGATIKLNGKSIGKTNADGTFSVKAKANSNLEFTSVGFATMQMQVPSSGAMTVLLKASNESLNEVVVIGYGSAKKKDLTGSVVSVSSKDFVKGALTSPEQLITGKVAGVSITPNGGAPGSGGVIRIRGGASVNASNDPLIVVDGVPLDGSGISGSANGLNMINPNDIESFNILKDASSAAIYGTRASNGVIIITTKKGKLGKPTFTFSSLTSLYTPSGKIKVLSANEFRNYINTYGTAEYKSMLGTANTDWQDEIYKTAMGTDNNLSVSGALCKKVPFRASIGYLNQQGILRGGSLKRTTASINVSPKYFKDHLKVEINLKGIVTENKFANEGAIGSAVTFDPTQPIYSGSPRYNGYWEALNTKNTNGLKGGNRNPIGLLKDYHNQSHVERSIGNIQLDYKFHFLPDLRLVGNIGYDIARGRGTVMVDDSAAQSYKRTKDENGNYHGGINNQYRQDKSNYLIDGYLNYTKSTAYGDVDILLGQSFQDNTIRSYNFQDYTTDGTVNNPQKFNADYGEGHNVLVSYYSRLRYSYKDKYYLTGSYRTDGSSRFPNGNRWGVFPSASAAWRIKNESFLKNVKVINDLKIRFGYGITGQQDGIGDFAYLANYKLASTQSAYLFGTTYSTPYTPVAYNGNPNYTWEKTTMFNYGVDFALFDNRITGYIEYYDRTTKDLLFLVDLPAGNITNKIVDNGGAQTNNGVELTINAAVCKKKDFTWDLGFNISYNKSTITQISREYNPSVPGQYIGGIDGGVDNNVQIHAVGHAKNSFYVYKQVYDKNGKPLDGVFEDLNRDGIINEKDYVFYKNSEPTVFAGLTSNFTYKKWNFGIVVRGNYGNYVYNNVRSDKGVNRNTINTNDKRINNASTELLQTGLSGNGDKYLKSNYWIENASFIKIDNISFGYNVGKIFNNKASLRITGNIQNVATITKYSGLDPEVFGGIDKSIYVRPRIFVLGFNMDF